MTERAPESDDCTRLLAEAVLCEVRVLQATLPNDLYRHERFAPLWTAIARLDDAEFRAAQESAARRGGRGRGWVMA